MRTHLNSASALCATLLTGLILLGSGCQATHSEEDFTSLFDGQSLKNWVLLGNKADGYGVKEVTENNHTFPVLFCAAGGGGNLLSEKEYADFILRFEFQLPHGANNGLAIRAPQSAGSLAYVGNELQILDGVGYEQKHNATLKPTQYHGSLYNVAPAKRGALKPTGQWNEQEVTVIGRRVKVVLNGQKILDFDINSVTDPNILRRHPGLLRRKGHIGFLGHNDYVAWRNIRIKELSSPELANTPPAGFTALFDGKTLNNWQGLLKGPNDNPIKRAALSAKDRRAAQAEADANMRAHWKVIDGTLEFDGKGRSLATDKDYRDFEMLVDWKIKDKGDSGIYLRGTPQVQIWDTRISKDTAVGSGGLFNNQKNPSKPIKRADHVAGDWNRFRILMVGDRVHVFLNGQLVVKDTVLENYWDRKQHLLRTGPIELQNHGNTLYFKNIYVREIETPTDSKPKEKK